MYLSSHIPISFICLSAYYKYCLYSQRNDSTQIILLLYNASVVCTLKKKNNQTRNSFIFTFSQIFNAKFIFLKISGVSCLVLSNVFKRFYQYFNFILYFILLHCVHIPLNIFENVIMHCER